MRVFISQPRYLPITSYLQRLYHADIFIILDNVKRQPYGWENRNKLLLPNPKWLTVPIASSRMSKICDAEVKNIKWIDEHIRTIENNYRNAPFFDSQLLINFYDAIKKTAQRSLLFVDIIVHQITFLCNLLEFEPKLVRASTIENDSIKNTGGPEKLRALCDKVGATEYISGGNGKEYGVENSFKGSSIKVLYHNPPTPKYYQPNETFVPYMACLDMIFNAGLTETANVVKADLELI